MSPFHPREIPMRKWEVVPPNRLCINLWFIRESIIGAALVAVACASH